MDGGDHPLTDTPVFENDPETPRAHATSVSHERSRPRRLSRSARAKAAFPFRSPAMITRAARTAWASSRLPSASRQRRPCHRSAARG
jgi:hypothetical protein